MDRYKAVEYLLDCRADRPSIEDTVFWRDIGTCDDEEEVDALERRGMIAAADILDLGLVERALEGMVKRNEVPIRLGRVIDTIARHGVTAEVSLD